MSKINSTKTGQLKLLTVQSTGALLLFFLGIFLDNSSFGQQDKPGIFYSITGKGLKDTSWLFGTYHLVGSSYMNDVPAVKEAFSKSKGVVVEVVIDSSKLPEVQAMGLLKNKTLTELLDKAFSDSLDSELMSTVGVGISQFNQLKPMNVILTLSIVYLMKNNNDQLKRYPGLPLDMNFVQEGKQNAMDITALETIEEQMDLLFNRLPEEEQVKQLKSFVRNKNEMVQLGDELMQNWFDHDLNKMYALYEKTLKLSGENDYLIKNRNDNWMKKLPGLLAKESRFIAVGALHLAGPDGLVNQLRQLGYTVTAVKL